MGATIVTFSPSQLDELVRGSAISEAVLARAGVHSCSNVRELQKMLASKRDFAEDQLPAIVFPYRRPGSPDAVLYAVKPAKPWKVIDRRDGTKSTKYVRTTGVLAPYVPPTVLERPSLLEEPGSPLWITEGEKKTLALDSAGFLAIGTCGVDCWGPKRVGHAPKRLFSELERAARGGREIFIVYDSDRETNLRGVRRAENALAAALADAGAKAYLVRLPPGPPEEDGTRGKVGVDDFLRDHGREALERLANAARNEGPIRQADAPVDVEKLERVVDSPSFRTAPVGDARMPPDYRLGRDGSLEKAGDGTIAHAPIFIDRILTDSGTGQVRVRVRFLVDGVWRAEIVERLAICDARELVKRLAPAGAPVSSNVAKAIVGFLTAYESVNRPKITRATLLTRGGWHELPGGRRVFVLGGEVVAAAGVDTSDLEVDRSAHPHIAGSTVRAGSRDMALAATRKIFDAHFAAASVIMASLAAPLAALLDVAAPAVHLVGPSSRGKTTAAQVAASIWGVPDSTRAESFLLTWRSTPNALTQRALAANHLPLVLDEAGELRDPAERADAVYALVNGHERARASREGGLRREAAWKVGLVSTGEMPLVDEHARTGAHARLIQLRMEDLGKLGASDVDALKSAVLSHHGWLGREWLAELAKLDRRQLASDFEPVRAEMQRMSSNSVESRGLELIAVLVLAERLASRLLGIGHPDGATMKGLPVFADRVEVVPEWERALDVLEQLAASQQDAFPVITREAGAHGVQWRFASSKPGRAVIGYLPEGRGEYWLLPGPLAVELAKHNLVLASCAREWRTRGLLRLGKHTDPKHALHVNQSLPDGRRAWVYVVERREDQQLLAFSDSAADDGEAAE